MSRDFYIILGLNKLKATQEDVYKAYCKMSIRWHPDKPENKGVAEARLRFSEIAEAYSVLIDPKKREEYDKKGSFSMPEFQGVAAYHAAQTLYKSVFGGVGLNEDGRAPEKQAAITRDLSVSLEELFSGCTKKLKITRQVLDPKDYSRTSQESSVIEIAIKAGWKSGTKITFERLGDERPGEVPADMVFVVSQKPHALFERRGNNLVFRTTVRLRDALVGGELRVKSLDDRQIKMQFKGPIKPGHEQVVAGEGMVDSKTGKKGDLIVVMDVAWPEEISEQAREKLASIAF